MLLPTSDYGPLVVVVPLVVPRIVPRIVPLVVPLVVPVRRIRCSGRFVTAASPQQAELAISSAGSQLTLHPLSAQS